MSAHTFNYFLNAAVQAARSGDNAALTIVNQHMASINIQFVVESNHLLIVNASTRVAISYQSLPDMPRRSHR